MPNFDRVKQALWDAFNGTRQPHVEPGLPLWLDEVGWQVPTEQSDAYTGVENVPTVDEAGQAAFHGSVVRLGRLRPPNRGAPFLPLDRRVGSRGDSRAEPSAPTARGDQRSMPLRRPLRTPRAAHSVPGARPTGSTGPQSSARRRSSGDARARDRGNGRRECDRDVRPRRRRQEADPHRSRQEGSRRRARPTFDPHRPYSFRCARRALGPSPRVLQAPARRSRHAAEGESLRARDLDGCGVQPQQDVTFHRSELAAGGALVASTAPAGPVLDRTARVSGSVKAPLGRRSRRGSSMGRGRR